MELLYPQPKKQVKLTQTMKTVTASFATLLPEFVRVTSRVFRSMPDRDWFYQAVCCVGRSGYPADDEYSSDNRYGLYCKIPMSLSVQL